MIDSTPSTKPDRKFPISNSDRPSSPKTRSPIRSNQAAIASTLNTQHPIAYSLKTKQRSHHQHPQT
ncbi:hypothetical protein [Pseudanabaena mucicola]|uniref:Uncharacterized protein n=1 Tax=Pseudanabaena mucicola FACHB-723 TaxID=2692860 RepID=A0ABR7ZT22_9CYAN|nr:hypothetical protein [Pseudanabaena mucicola]MBD2186672.1 hypothetical protein [Pseudanabaena mucicola FACHB-723]